MVAGPVARRKRRQDRLWLSLPMIALAIGVLWYSMSGNSETRGLGRKLQGNEGFCERTGPAEVGGIYPPDLLTYEQICDGAWVLHLIGALYMFLALSIVCDEFFVPALEVIVERFQISDDVAGATFMAAGGSAPELATSVIGTFVAVSDVGFGTIVGSAVFNVLFVIACCAIFSKELLTLTWWPLARDSVYYSITLAALIGFFIDGRIEWWEALIQFLLYIGYVIIMAYNVALYRIVRNCMGRRDRAPVSPAPTEATGFDAEPGATASSMEHDVAMARGRRGSVIDRANAAAGVSHARATFHCHVLHALLFESDPLGKGTHTDQDTRFSTAVKIVLERTRTAKEPAGSNSKASLIMRAARNEQLRGAAAEAAHPASDAGGVARDLAADDDDNPEASDAAASASSSSSSSSSAAGSASASDKAATTASKASSSNGAKNITTTAPVAGGAQSDATSPSGITPATVLMPQSAGPVSPGTGATANPPSPSTANGHTKLVAEVGSENKEGDDDDEDGEGEDTIEDSLRWPQSTCKRVMWVIMAPLVFPLAYTVPDVRIKGRENLYPVTFIMSIVWIAIYSNFMVWWATTFGAALAIPDPVMGYTLLAAGTSVPDLLTSVLVARQGLGDMAVSSSIGSNIFDITVGLPLPWLLRALIDGFAVTVNSGGLRFSVFLLFIMLVSVIIVIALAGWKLSKPLALAMFVLYGVFMALSLLVEYGNIQAPF